MYYPKSQVKTNLYTNGGEYIVLNTNTSYKGYYYETSTGEYFSGRTPNEIPSFKLIKDIAYETSGESSIPSSFGFENDNFYLIEDGYARSTNLSFNQKAPSSPKQTYPVLTDNDYKLGEFQRYFLKKGNETKFLEISLEDYRKYVNRDKDVMFELYTPIQINWILTGEEKQVYQVNQSIIARAEREQNLPGFTQYFRGKFAQFYR
jgi:hypothetical protein